MSGERVIRRFGIVGGPGAGGAAENLLARLGDPANKTEPAGADAIEVFLERCPSHINGQAAADRQERKIEVFDAILSLAARGAGQVLLPYFQSRAFLDEIAAETPLHIVSLMEALRDHLARQHPGMKRLGVLAADSLRGQRLFESYFAEGDWTILYPPAAAKNDNVMALLDGAQPIRGERREAVVGRLAEICSGLADQGAEAIVPAAPEFMALAGSLRERGLPVVDVLGVYAEYALSRPAGRKNKPFKIGVVGGVGPAATVDFVDKIVRNTPARRDQEHLKVVVEQNPQIPDRTENLLNGGADPTLALYAACRRLQADDASIITIPCNTAHAFVERIQPHLAIPIVSMLKETVNHIREHCAGRQVVGLLATTGTLRSRVYHDVILPAGFELRVPDEANQQRVMNAIYGPKGVKAGYTAGECTEDLLLAMASLVGAGVQIVILGCTELPLLVKENEAFPIAGKTVMVLDPTSILARKCVSLGMAAVRGA